MIYVAAVGAGLVTIGLAVAAGGWGYLLARAPRQRRMIAGITAGFVVVLGVLAAVLGSLTYARLSTVAIVTVPDQSTQTVSQSSVPQPATDAWMHFQSDGQDFIGAGKHQVWTIKESNFTTRGTKRDIQAFVSGQGDLWDLEFRAPSNGDLRTGQFDNAERAPFVTGKAAGLEIDGDGRGCNTLSGRFQIKSLTWTSAATVAEMDVVFEQHCEGGPPALRGELWFTTEVGVHNAPPSSDSNVAI